MLGTTLFFPDNKRIFQPNQISGIKLWIDSSDYSSITSYAEFTLDNASSTVISIQCKQNIMPLTVTFTEQDQVGASYNPITRDLLVEWDSLINVSSMVTLINALSGYTSVRIGLEDDAASSGSRTSMYVVQIDDKSGNGNHAVQGTAARRPITGAATINGRNVISFDGPTNDQYLKILNMSCSPNTVAVVYKSDETTFSSWNGTITSRTAPNSTKVAASSANSGMTAIASGTGITDTSQSGLNVYLDGTSYSYSQFADYGTGGLSNLPMSSPHFVMWTDDLSSGTQNWVIGADTFDVVGNRHWNGYISEILIYSTALSTTNINLVTNYLKPKWGIS